MWPAVGCRIKTHHASQIEAKTTKTRDISSLMSWFGKLEVRHCRFSPERKRHPRTEQIFIYNGLKDEMVLSASLWQMLGLWHIILPAIQLVTSRATVRSGMPWDEIHGQAWGSIVKLFVKSSVICRMFHLEMTLNPDANIDTHQCTGYITICESVLN